MSRLDALYPPEAREVPVVPAMASPRRPDAPRGIRNHVSARDFYGPAMTAEVEVTPGEHVAFIDKAFPHSRFDTMLLASDDDVRTAVTDLSDEVADFVFGAIPRFAAFVSDPEVDAAHDLRGGRLHVSYNYDRHTTDRENSMFYDKRFHLHLNYFPARDIVLAPVRRWADLPDRSFARRLLDPVAYLAEPVVRDIVHAMGRDLPLLPVDRRRDLALGLPAGPKFALDGWAAAGDSSTVQHLRTLHEAADLAHRDLHEAFTGEVHRPREWGRPALLDPDEIDRRVAALPWVGTESRTALTVLARALRSVTDDEIAAMRQDPSALTSRLTLGGLDYAISMTSAQPNAPDSPVVDAGPVHVIQQVKLFADIGGAGMPPMGGVPIVRLDRGSGTVLTKAEMADRAAFQAGFRTEYLDRTTRKVASR